LTTGERPEANGNVFILRLHGMKANVAISHAANAYSA